MIIYFWIRNICASNFLLNSLSNYWFGFEDVFFRQLSP